MKLIKLSDILPPLEKKKSSKQEIKKLSKLAEKVKKILGKEGKIQPEGNNENLSPRGALDY